MRIIMRGIFLFASFLMSSAFLAQGQEETGLPKGASLQDCIDFALQNRGNVQQALIDEEIGERDIAIALSGWFPQISANAQYNRNIIIPTNVIGGQVIRMGQNHSAAGVLQADQQILNPQLIQASKAVGHIRQQNVQNTESALINTVVEVSKGYYDILTTEEQLKIIDENIARLDKQFADARARYDAGLADPTDYKRAQISLSNARVDRARNQEVRKYKYAYLKELIGLDTDEELYLSFDNAAMESEILLDTTTQLQYQNRVEYRQLETARQLQSLNTQYHKWTFLPNVSAFYNYAWDFRHNSFSDLFGQDYPRSVFGLSLSIPIFQGTKRTQEIRRSRLQEERLDWDAVNLRNRIHSEYELAMATYKAGLADLHAARSNVTLSEEVYNTIKLQYDEGIKTYLDLMTAETDLRTTQLNYLSTLYNVLSGKLDVQRALGTIDIPSN